MFHETFRSSNYLPEWLASQDDDVLFTAMQVVLAIDAADVGLDDDAAWQRALDEAPVAWLAYVTRGLRGSVGFWSAVGKVYVGAAQRPVPAEILGWERGLPVS